jgi:DNA-binding transcriptional ArsR family regulator
MDKLHLKIIRPVDNEANIDVVSRFMPEIGIIGSNQIRAGIMHLLINSPETMHSMKVEEICFKMGIRQSICIHHLERLLDWKLVEIKKNQRYGKRTRRSIWGLDLRYPDWILECYKSIRNHFFSEKDLYQITNINKSLRVYS